MQLFVPSESQELDSIFKRLKKKEISCEQGDTGKKITQRVTDAIVEKHREPCTSVDSKNNPG